MKDCLKNKFPKHVAIIMDGNCRWAKSKGKTKKEGYQAGMEAIRKSIKFALRTKMRSLTLFAFSIENWNRSRMEINIILKIFSLFLDIEMKYLNFNNVKFEVIGDIRKFEINLQNRIKHVIALTKRNTGLNLNIAANYGGTWDITHGVRLIAEKVKNGSLSPIDINKNLVGKFISLYGQPRVDFLIRTGGEYRISNFLLWQLAYTEFYFTDIFWPDFDEKFFQNALLVFKKRERRFGNTKL